MEFIYNGKVIDGIQYTRDNFNEIKHFIKDSPDITTYTIYEHSNVVKEMTRIIKYNIYMDNPKQRVSNIHISAEDQSLARVYDNASQRYLVKGDWVFHNSDINKYFCKPKEVVEEKYTPLYYMSHNYVNTVELPEFDENDNYIYLTSNETGNIVHKAIRYTGRNSNDIIRILDEFKANPAFKDHYYYMEKSMKHDINDPVFIINRVYDDESKNKNNKMLIMYPGDYLMFSFEYHDGGLPMTNKIINTKNIYRIAKMLCEDNNLTLKTGELEGNE